ncbi:MAG TPA: response regulator, partial [Allocoleopsis sp.]
TEQSPDPIEQEHACLHFAIQDTGEGIAATDLDRIFEAFEQTSSGKKLVEGTGLGLTLSRKFVELMGGALSVSSTIGKGSTFAFNLPVKLTLPPEERSLSDHHSLITGLAPNQPHYRILVVDDQLENRELLAKLLEPIGFLVELATNGAEAIDQWQQWHPDLFLMDIRMPVLDGLKATLQIRETEQSSHCHLASQQPDEDNQPVHLTCPASSKHHTPIIALSASVFHDDRDRAFAYGCNEFLKKPFQATDLLDTIARTLNLNYTYTEENSNSHLNLGSELPTSALNGLPPAWIEHLHQAATSGDDAQILNLIHQLPPKHALLIEKLGTLARQFEFDRILTLLENCSLL